jgi:hypothetical protein
MDQGVDIFLRIDAREACLRSMVRSQIGLGVGIARQKEPRVMDA